MILNTFVYSNLSFIRFSMNGSGLKPFDLFGLTLSSNIQDLRRSYYQFALCCHPDKGGDNESMKTITLAYKWIYDQMTEQVHHSKSFQEYFGDNIDKAYVPNFTDTLAETYGYTKDIFYQICNECDIPLDKRDILFIPSFQWILMYHDQPVMPEQWRTTVMDYLHSYKKDASTNNTSVYIPMCIPHGYSNCDINQSENYYMEHSKDYVKTMTIYHEPETSIRQTDAFIENISKIDDYSVNTPISMYDYEDAFKRYNFTNLTESSNISSFTQKELNDRLEYYKIERHMFDLSLEKEV